MSGLLDLRQAAEYLNVSYDWLQRQAAAGKVPHTRLSNKYVRFSSEHIEQIIKNGERVTPEEVTRSAPARRRRSSAAPR